MRSETTARWAGLAAKDYLQEGATNLWADAGPLLQAADRGDGLAASALTTVARQLIPDELSVVEGHIGGIAGFRTAVWRVSSSGIMCGCRRATARSCARSATAASGPTTALCRLSGRCAKTRL